MHKFCNHTKIFKVKILNYQKFYKNSYLKCKFLSKSLKNSKKLIKWTKFKFNNNKNNTNSNNSYQLNRLNYCQLQQN